MSLFRFNWLRRFVRRHTSPMEVDRAELWKKRLSIAYMLITWNAFGLVCFMFYKGKGDWAKYYGLKSEEEINTSPGKPSNLEDIDNPDWAPSQHLGHVSQATVKRKGIAERKIKVDKRKLADLIQKDEVQPEVLDNQFEIAEDQHSGLASQTDLTIKIGTVKFHAEKICTLEKKIENFPLGLMDDTTNHTK